MKILYLSYGQGIHEQEIIFSLLTAWRWMSPGSSGFEFLVYTDRPQTFDGLPVEVEEICPAQWNEWSGPLQYQHRRKIPALRRALEKSGEPVVLLDGDTWWRKAPELLFERIGPGRSVLHLREGRVNEIDTAPYRETAGVLESARLVDPNGREQSISIDSWMWNAGVIGINPVDLGLLDEVLHWTDALCSKSTKPHVLEQFAFSHVLSEKSELSEAGDIVFHYWPPYLHDPFKKRIDEFLAAGSALPLEDRARCCYRNRPRPTLLRRGKVLAKKAAQQLGLLKGRIRSNEW